MDYTIDCTNKRLGRLASEIAIILQGKKNPNYNPRLEGEDKVLIQNIEKLGIGGNKEEQKKYYSHTTQIGHLKERTYKQIVSKHGKQWVLKKAVEKMLPKNRLQSKRMKRLIIES